MTEESKIRERAYELWEKDGSPEGAGEFYWRLAQEQLAAELQPSDSDTAEPAPDEWENSLNQSFPTAPEDREQAINSDWPAKGEASRY